MLFIIVMECMEAFIRSHLLRVCVTTALVFQFSYVTRFAYVQFSLAPDCPVVGVNDSPSGDVGPSIAHSCHGLSTII